MKPAKFIWKLSQRQKIIFAVTYLILGLILERETRTIGLCGDILGWRGRSIDYASIDAAGIAAIVAINPTSIRVGKEYAGKICQSSTGWFYTTPLAGNDTTVKVSKSGLCPIGSKIVGDYHTHGSPDLDESGELFSMPFKLEDCSNDVATNQYGYRLLFWYVPPQIGYLGTPTGKIAKYDIITTDVYFWQHDRWVLFQENLSEKLGYSKTIGCSRR